MRIVVLIKQVPNTTKVKLDPKTNNLIRDGVESILNPYDLYALETALEIKEKMNGSVAVLSMGPLGASEVIRYAFCMGADEGYLLSDRGFAGSDTLATSYILSQGIKQIGDADLILCGKQAIDGDTAQVPSEIAGHLMRNCITNVGKVTEVTEESIKVRKDTDFAQMEVESKLPLVMTIEKGSCEPRLPLLKSFGETKEKKITVLGVKDMILDENQISIQGSPTRVVKVFAPERTKKAKMLLGTAQEQVEELLDLISQKDLRKKERKMECPE